MQPQDPSSDRLSGRGSVRAVGPVARFGHYNTGRTADHGRSLGKENNGWQAEAQPSSLAAGENIGAARGGDLQQIW